MKSVTDSRFWIASVVLLLLGRISSAAPSSTAFTYQGQLKHAGNPVANTGDFVFSLWDAAGNLPPPLGGTQIGNTITLTDVSIVNGLFTVPLDFGVNPYATNEARWLQVAVRVPAGSVGLYSVLNPRQGLTAAPYALGVRLPLSESVSTGGNAVEMINTGSGRAGRFEVDNPAATLAALLCVHNGGGNALTTTQTGNGRSALLEVNNAASAANALEVNTNGGAGSQAIYALHTGQGDCGLFQITNSASIGEAVQGMTNGAGHAVQGINTGTGRAGYFTIDNPGNSVSALLGITNGTGNGVVGEAASGSGYGGSFSNTGGGLALHASGDAAITGSLGIGTDNPVVRLQVVGGTDASLSDGGNLVIGQTTGPNIVMDNNEIMARNDGATSTLFLNNDGGDVVISPGHTTRVGVLEITGGADLAERFDIDGIALEPGMVVVIDSDHPGALRPSTQAYDHKVAGIISGAGGVQPGMMMSQTGTAAGGVHPVALTGRVYALVDAGSAAIEPGDLLTTSDVFGHAMKVGDPARAAGAVIGKAMTSLPAGARGLVLVLVSLQ